MTKVSNGGNGGAKTVLQRVEENERRTEALEMKQQAFQSYGQAIQNVRGATGQLTEVINAMIQVLGGEDLDKKVEAQVKQNRIDQKKRQDDRQRAILDKLIADGQIATADTISADSLVTIEEFRATRAEDGTITKGEILDSYAQLYVSNFQPSVQSELIGKNVGYVYFEPKSSTAFEVKGIYGIGQPTPVTEQTPAAEQGSDTAEQVNSSETQPSA